MFPEHQISILEWFLICDTEDWSNGFAITGINYILKCFKIGNGFKINFKLKYLKILFFIVFFIK